MAPAPYKRSLEGPRAMIDSRLIAADALFMVLYIGLAAAFVGLLAAVGMLYAAGYDLDALYIGAASGAMIGQCPDG